MKNKKYFLTFIAIIAVLVVTITGFISMNNKKKTTVSTETSKEDFLANNVVKTEDGNFDISIEGDTSYVSNVTMGQGNFIFDNYDNNGVITVDISNLELSAHKREFSYTCNYTDGYSTVKTIVNDPYRSSDIYEVFASDEVTAAGCHDELGHVYESTTPSRTEILAQFLHPVVTFEIKGTTSGITYYTAEVESSGIVYEDDNYIDWGFENTKIEIPLSAIKTAAGANTVNEYVAIKASHPYTHSSLEYTQYSIGVKDLGEVATGHTLDEFRIIRNMNSPRTVTLTCGSYTETKTFTEPYMDEFKARTLNYTVPKDNVSSECELSWEFDVINGSLTFTNQKSSYTTEKSVANYYSEPVYVNISKDAFETNVVYHGDTDVSKVASYGEAMPTVAPQNDKTYNITYDFDTTEFTNQTMPAVVPFDGYYYNGTKYNDSEGNSATECDFYSNNTVELNPVWLSTLDFTQMKEILSQYTREGYTLVGWYDQDDNVLGDTYEVTKDTTFTARWEQNAVTYVLTLNKNDGSSNPILKTIDCVNGVIAEDLPTVEREHYTFDGWFTEATGGEQVTNTTVLNEDATAYAHYTKNAYTVTFDTNGHGDNTTATVESGDALGNKLPTLLDTTSHKFLGWFTEATGGTAVTSSTIVTSNVTYYAHWELITYTVTFDTNSHGTVDSRTVNGGSAVGTLPTLENTTSHRFLGWFTEATGGNEVSASTTVTSNVTYYAHWELITYTITFDTNDHGTVDSKTVNGGSIIGTLPTLENTTSHRFLGWFTQASGGTEITDTHVVTSDMTIFAHWEVITYTVTFDTNNHGSVDSRTVNGGSAVGTLPTLENTSTHRFVGWFTEATGGSEVNASTTVTSNVTYYAHWEVITYTVTFDTNNHGTVNPMTVNAGSAIGTLPTLTGDTYNIFKGWFTQATGGDSVTAATVITSNVTYYAHWDIIYVLTLDKNDGSSNSILKTINCTNGQIGETLPTPEREHYTFAGWYTEASGGSQFSATTISANTTIYAHWTIKKYTVTFNTDGHGSIDSITVDALSTINNLPTVADFDGCTFEGWYYNSTKLTSSTQITSNLNVTANYTCRTRYDITFHVHSNDSQDFTFTGYEGDTIETIFDVRKSGYILLGWFTAETGGTKLQANTRLSASTSTEYHAHWIEANIAKNDTDKTITLNTFGATYDVGSIKTNDGYNNCVYKNKNNEAKGDTDLLATGDKITINGQDYTFVLIGDLNGDGKINSVDFARLWNHLDRSSSRKITDDYQLLAGDITGDTKIKAADYAQLWNILKR